MSPQFRSSLQQLPRFVLLGAFAALLLASCSGRKEERGGSDTSAVSSGYAEVEVSNGGTITGHVVLSGGAPSLPAFEISANPEVCSSAAHNNRLDLGSGNGIRYAVVYLEGIRRGKPFVDAQRTGLTMNQVGCQYVPHVIAAPVGASVMVLNGDDAPHNVRIEDASNDHVLLNRAQPSKGMQDTFHVAGVGAFPVGCDYHPWMNAYVFGVDNPYYAVTGADGSFSIDHVPPGKYRVRMWLNGVDTRPLKDNRGNTVNYRYGDPIVDSTEVVVPAGGSAAASFTIDAARLGASGGKEAKK